MNEYIQDTRGHGVGGHLRKRERELFLYMFHPSSVSERASE